MKILPPVTNIFLHRIARASTYDLTPEMDLFLKLLPINGNAAHEVAIEVFNNLLDNMES